jgi:thymidylate synthase
MPLAKLRTKKVVQCGIVSGLTRAQIKAKKAASVKGDIHLYSSHIDQAKEQLSKAPASLPQLKLAKAQNIFSYKYEHFKIDGYDA